MLPAVEALLAEDVKTTTDGGGEFRSALPTIVGRDKVSRLYLAIAVGARGAHMSPVASSSNRS